MYEGGGKIVARTVPSCEAWCIFVEDVQDMVLARAAVLQKDADQRVALQPYGVRLTRTEGERVPSRRPVPRPKSSDLAPRVTLCGGLRSVRLTLRVTLWHHPLV